MNTVKAIDAEIARLERVKAIAIRFGEIDADEVARGIADRIKSLREENDMNQTDFAEAIGMWQTMVSRMEAGTRQLRASEAAVMAGTFGVSLDWLILGGGPNE